MTESSSTSYQLTSASSDVHGLPAVGGSRESSSGASSQSERNRSGGSRPYSSRPPKAPRPFTPRRRDLEIEEDPRYAVTQRDFQSPTDESMDTVEGIHFSTVQAFQDQRALNFDQRSVHVEQHVRNPDPSIVGALAAEAASSGLRAEAAQVVAQVREAALQAATDYRVEAVQAVANARIETTVAQASAEASRVSALAEIQYLRKQLETSQRENQMLREQFVKSEIKKSVMLRAFNKLIFVLKGLSNRSLE